MKEKIETLRTRRSISHYQKNFEKKNLIFNKYLPF